jgi:hypothetical protein
VKKPLACFQRGNKRNTVFSFGQISPLKKGVGGKDVFLKSFFYYKRERESEFTREIGCNIFSIIGIILS